MYKKFLVKWIFSLFLVVFSFFMGFKTQLPSFVFFFWLLVSVFIINIVWLVLVYFNERLCFSRKIPLKIEEDDFLDVEVEVENKGFFPVFDIVLIDYLGCAYPGERQKNTLISFLGLGSKVKINYRCLCYQRGRYDLGPFTAYFFDPLGLFFLKKKYDIYSEVYVYPHTFNIHKFPALTKGASPWFGIATSRVSGDEDEFYGVREYKRGDSLKRIHWMASARKNKLIAKEFQRQNFFRATIIFNLDKDSNFGDGRECVCEYMIKIIASISRYLVNLGVSIEIVSHIGEAVHIPFNKGAEHLENILKFLTIAQAESKVTLAELFETFYRDLLEDTSLIIVMTDKDKAHLPSILSLGFRSVSCIPIILDSASFLRDYNPDSNPSVNYMDIPDSVKLNPIYISCKDNLEEKF